LYLLIIMLISNSRKFIFIHIPKTAGTSIEESLLPYCSGKKGFVNWLIRRLVKYVRFPNKQVFALRTYEAHVTLAEAELLLPGKVIDDYFKFAVVRNPYDRFVSFYYHLLKQTTHRWHEYAVKAGSFAGFIEQMKHIPEPSQKHYLMGRYGNINMDYIIRFEDIQNDYKEVCKKLNIDFNLPVKNTTKHVAYEELYTTKEKEFVYNLYKEDFDAFGYKR